MYLLLLLLLALLLSTATATASTTTTAAAAVTSDTITFGVLRNLLFPLPQVRPVPKSNF